MLTLSFRRVMPLVLAFVFFAQQAPAQPKPPTTKPATTQAADAEGWKSLFDGKTLTNWKASDFGGDVECRVEKGEMIIPAGASLNGLTWTGPALPKNNYEIALDVKRINGSDFFCGLTFPVKDSHASLILGGWGGGLVGISSLDGEDAAHNDSASDHNFVSDKWYHVRMRITDDKLEAWLDDEQVVDVKTTDRKVDIRIDIENAKPFGFSTYQTSSAVRNFRYRELPRE